MTLKTPNLFDKTYPAINLAMCQVYTQPWEVQDNYSRLLDAIDLAVERKAQIAVTPECVFHGYGDQSDPDAAKKLFDASEHIDGDKITTLREKARRNKMHILVGFAERGEDHKIYNSAAMILNDGNIAYVYRKVHCRDFEDAAHDGLFTAGDDFYCAQMEFEQGTFNIGTMICFDRELPESVRSLRALGSELILCPLATNTSDLHVPAAKAENETLTRIRAAENEVFIAVVNHAGRFNGGSFIVGPSGEVVLQMNEKPGVEIVELPLGIVQQKFHSNPLGWMGWGFRRPEVYNKYLS